jgi:hypothetical protein
MPPTKRIIRGVSIRLPLDDLRDYRVLAHGLGNHPISRVLVTFILEIARPLLVKEPLAFTGGGLISDVHRHPELVALCHRIGDRGLRSLSNTRTQTIWLPFKETERTELSQIWQALHWTEGKLVLECLREATILGGLQGDPVKAPAVTILYRGSQLFKQQIETDHLALIGAVLAKARLLPRGLEESSLSKDESFTVDPPLSI